MKLVLISALAALMLLATSCSCKVSGLIDLKCAQKVTVKKVVSED